MDIERVRTSGDAGPPEIRIVYTLRQFMHGVAMRAIALVLAALLAGTSSLVSAFAQERPGAVAESRTSASPEIQRADYKIAFTSYDVVGGIIFVMNLDGSGRTRVTNRESDFGSWSPDGKRITFNLNGGGRDEDRQLWVARADGSNPEVLIKVSGYLDPRWSPDGQQIACIIPEIGVYTIDVNGKHDLRRLFLEENLRTEALDWSPNAKQIAYGQQSHGNPPTAALCIIDADGRNQRILIKELVPGGTPFLIYPAFSPDGTQIAFCAYGSSGYDLHLIKTDGSNRRIVCSKARLPPSRPVWSPDGKQLAFCADPGGTGRYQLHVVNSDGTALRRLTNHSWTELDPDWSPDGKKIVYTANPNRNCQIHVINADGTDEKRISNTESPRNDRSPKCSPLLKK
jgi:WD40 repeat protein